MNSVVGFNEKKANVSVDGYGINYKNFAEVTFLWCINQTQLSAKEKLKLAYDIIEFCKAKGKSEGNIKRNNNSIDNKTT